jgi:hypothetical protein
MDYSIVFDPETSEWVAEAGDEIFVSDCAPLAFGWLAEQILADEAAAC